MDADVAPARPRASTEDFHDAARLGQGAIPIQKCGTGDVIFDHAAACMFFECPGVQQFATNQLHVNVTYRHSDENRINTGLCSSHAVIVHNLEAS
jgi:hypothetical protein